MTKNIWIGIGIAVVVAVAGTYWYEDEIRGYPPPWAATSTQPASSTQSGGRLGGAGIANPASTNCITLGGTLEIVDTANGGGQVGYCHLKDGRVCEEWALFRDGSCTAPQ